MRPFDLLWEQNCGASIISVAATPNFSTIGAATVGKKVFLFDSDGNSLWDNPYPVDHEAWAIDISEDGLFIAVGTASKLPSDGTLYVLTRDRRLVWSHRIRAPIWSTSLSGDGEVLIASTWGENRLFIFRRQGRTYHLTNSPKIDGCGLYGAVVTRNGQIAVVASYEAGLTLLDDDGSVLSSNPLETGLYNVAIAHGANRIVVGTRDGTFLRCALDDALSATESQPISQRPLCGVSVADNGILVAAGSFDGRVIVTTDHGDPLWSYQTKGEVWSTAMSSGGGLVCAGAGDHRLLLFRNRCDASAYQEIAALERALLDPPSVSAAPGIASLLVSLYLKQGLTRYGHHRFQRLQQECPDFDFVQDNHRKFLEATVESEEDESSHLYLGQLLMDEKQYWEAIRHFQFAARSPSLRSSGQRKSAECFAELGSQTAAASASRQSREQHLDDDARNVLYLLGRSYEDCGAWREAATIYEMILAWDADFRNCFDKMQIAKRFSSSEASPSRVAEDDTGLTVNLLGPDAPRRVDEKLRPMVAARHREVRIQAGDQETVQSSVAHLVADEIFSQGIRRDVSRLDYSTQLFLKYDFGLPEDEMKKFLETVNAFPYFQEQLQASKSGTCTSLDIGSATGRYPMLLSRLGFHSYGIDREKEAIAYSIDQSKMAAWPKFIHGDALNMRSHLDADVHFAVITCMMGTFEHIPKEKQASLVTQMRERLAPGGVAIISLWDVECRHLAYLSIYGEDQKELIRQNGRTQEEMQTLLTDCGLTSARIVPFCLLPQSIVYDLGIDSTRPEDIGIAARADLAARALFSSRHGEMFLAIGRRESNPQELSQ